MLCINPWMHVAVASCADCTDLPDTYRMLQGVLIHILHLGQGSGGQVEGHRTA